MLYVGKSRPPSSLRSLIDAQLSGESELVGQVLISDTLYSLPIIKKNQNPGEAYSGLISAMDIPVHVDPLLPPITGVIRELGNRVVRQNQSANPADIDLSAYPTASR